MIKKNIGRLILTSAIILLPIAAGLVLWDKLPGTFAIHWNMEGEADGISAKLFAVLGIPLILLAFHWICVLITAADPKNKGQNKKMFGIVLWIIPTLSVAVSAVMYSIALGIEFDMEKITLIMIGLMFVVLGNYLPKCKQNNTIGIKLPWTLNDEENWNKTHRFASKFWVVGGIVLLISAFFPNAWIPFIILPVLILLAVIPTAYSYVLYKKSGKAVTKSKNGKNIIISLIITAVVLGAAAVLLFTGNVNVQYGEDSFTVKAAYWSDIDVSYDLIDSIEYRDEFDGGTRTNGFGSPRLLLGTFRNDEFGYYTRYTYTEDNGYVVLSVDGKMLVLSGVDEDATKEIYNSITERLK